MLVWVEGWVIDNSALFTGIVRANEWVTMTEKGRTCENKAENILCWFSMTRYWS